MNSKGWMVATALLAAGTAQATCYSVHQADGSLILESSRTPVNLTFALGDTVPEKFGAGTFMTISDLGVFCKERRGAHWTHEMVAVDASMKPRAQVKAEAPVEQATDEELLALKPEGISAPPPVQGVEVKAVEPGKAQPEGDAGKVREQVGAGEVAGKVAARQE